MTTISLRDLYEVDNHITMACELFYICELGKSLSRIKYKDEDYKLSIKGITFDNQLRNTPIWPYFCQTIKNEYLVDADKSIDTKNVPSINKALVQDITIAKKTLKAPKPNEIPISYDVRENGRPEFFFSDRENLSVLSGGIVNQTWVSILAYFTIRKYFMMRYNGALEVRLSIMISNETMNKYNALSYLMLLYENKRISYWINLIVVTSTATTKKGQTEIVRQETPIENANTEQLQYEAWLQDGRDRGLVENKYKDHKNDYDWILNEKKKVIAKENLEVGDVVALYQRNKSSIVNMDYAVIRAIKEKDIAFEIIHNKKTILDTKYEMKGIDETSRQMFASDMLKKLVSKRRMNIVDLGINKDLYEEEYFIVTLDNIEDDVICHVRDKNGIETTKKATQQFYLYMILNEYGIEFNKGKYEKLYLKRV